MNESARIARGPVRPLSQLTAADAEAVVIPGGFGAAKNLSDFGFKGESTDYGRPIGSSMSFYPDFILILS